jgi:hypothetical protein
MWKQPFENKKELGESYLKMPPEALLIRKIEPNIAVDAEELARAQWFWERRPKKLILSTERALIILIFFAGIWVAAMCLSWHALVETMVLPGIGCTIVAAMPTWAYLNAGRFARWNSDLFVRNFQASSNGSSTIARRQFLNALSLLSPRSCEPEC